MTAPDTINGLFELVGALAVMHNIRAVIKDKKVAGVRALPMFFFGAWSVWNTFYYPYLHQWFSFVGGAVMAVSNISYAILLAYYRRQRPLRDGSGASRSTIELGD